MVPRDLSRFPFPPPLAQGLTGVHVADLARLVLADVAIGADQVVCTGGLAMVHVR